MSPIKCEVISERTLSLSGQKFRNRSQTFKECLAADARYAEFHINLSENDNGVEIIQSGVIDLF